MTRICLSIAKMDDAFQTMVDVLGEHAQVDVVGLDGFSLEGYDIFIGKKLSADALRTADRLKAVFAYKTGVDEFPLEQLREMGEAGHAAAMDKYTYQHLAKKFAELF